MKKLLAMLAVLITAVSIRAADIANFGVEAGYNNHYIVNGVSRADDAAFVGFNAVKSLKFADVYVGGTLLPTGTSDQSHWVAGLGKSLDLNKDWSVRLTTDATRHQAGGFGIPNSTEFGVKLALNNPYVTPYVRGAFDIDLKQNGVYVGAQRVQSLLYGFTLTPAVEYGYVNDYTAVNVKGTLARPFKTTFGTLTPFAEVGWFDNNFNSARFNWATKELSGAVVYSAGLKFNF